MTRRIQHPAWFTILLWCSVPLACSSGPRAARNPIPDDRIPVVVRNDSRNTVTAYLVLNREAAITLGRVDALETRTFRLHRLPLMTNQLELRAYAREARTTNLEVVEAAQRGTLPQSPYAAVQYVSGPFSLGGAAEIQWKLSGMNYLSSLSFR
ncbi:MAG: hypothetical protein ACREMQ_07290 [Longimicrobiales bacterium]